MRTETKQRNCGQDYRGISQVVSVNDFQLRRAFEILCLSLCIAFVLSGWAESVWADEAKTKAAADKTIRQVVVEGNESVADSLIMANIRNRAGAVLNEKLIIEDAKRLIAMPELYDVKWKIVSAEGLADVIFTVIESPRIEKLVIVGNKNIKTSKLAEKLEFGEGDFLDRYLINIGLDSLTEQYHGKGYHFAAVSLDEKKLKEKRQVIYKIVEGPRVRVKKVKFDGNESLRRGKLKGKAKTKAWFPIFRKGNLDDEQIERDCLGLADYYHEIGFLDARVFAKKEFNHDKTRVTVSFIIEEGAKYHIENVRFEGNKQFSREQLLEAVTLEKDQVLTRKRRTFAQRAVKRAYGKEGYIYADVKVDLEYTEKEGQADAVIRIEENDSYMLGRLIVRGNYQTRDKVIRRDFSRHGFLPGGIYDTSASDRAETRLKGAGLFENMTVTPIGSAPDERDALVDVTEARTGMVLFGVGVDTNSGVMGQIALEQRNFDIFKWPSSLSELFRGEAFVGGGQRMRLNFEPGTRVSRGSFKFHEPYLFDQPYYLDLNLFIFRRWRDSYLERRRGGIATIGHRFKNDWFVDFGTRVEGVTVSDLDDGYVPNNSGGFDYVILAPQDMQDVKGDNMLTSLKFGVGRNTTDRMFRPTEGYKISAAWEQVGAMGGEFSYAALSAGGTKFKTIYMDITERKTVWAAQVRGSKIIGDAPVFERYYAGGIGSLRGFDYRGVSPRGGVKDDPIGSEYILLANTEITHPLYEETLYGKVFCDSGFISEGPCRVTVGFGLELVVPQIFQTIPMHFDFGFPIFSDDKDDEEVFSFTFGMTF